MQSFSVAWYELPLRTPFPAGGEMVRVRRGAILRVEEDGRCGYGEMAPLAGLHRESLQDALEGVQEATCSGSMPMAPSASFALSCAQATLVDERRFGFGRSEHSGVGVNAVFSGDAAAARAAIERGDFSGYRTVKVKVGLGKVADDAALIAAMLDGLDSAVRLRLDGNRRLTLTSAVRMMKRLDVARIEYMEEPLRNPLELPELSRRTGITMAIDESLHEVRTVQAYGHEAHTRARFDAAAEAAYASGVHRIRVKAWLISLVMLIGFCAVGLIMWVGGHDVFEGRITGGQLSAFVFYAAVVAGGAGTVSEVWGEIQRAAGATERLFELLDTQPALAPQAPVITLPANVKGALRFDDVSFTYPARAETPVLHAVSFSVSPGERVALVGPSGAGKSTIFALILRFYDPSSGRLLIDGADIKHCDPLALRRAVAIVPQDPVIFSGSVSDNVRFGRPEATDAEIRDACAAAHALEFIQRLPQRFDTDLGERGVKLSGGQRQRISIARALLADRPILLLDEATSSLDAESERQVAAALEQLERGRTTLVIAHRLATVLGCDRILVMEHGRIVEEGTHATLVAKGGLYARLAELQFNQAGKAAERA